MQTDSETQSTNIKKISEISNNDIKEIFSEVIRSSEFYEQQIAFDDFLKFIQKNNNITDENWITIINNIRKYRKDSEYFLQLLNFITIYENEKNKIYKVLYEYSTNIPLLKCFKTNNKNLNFSYSELNEEIKRIKNMNIYAEQINENTLLIGGKGIITKDLIKNYKNIKTIIFDESIQEIKVQKFEKSCASVSPFSIIQSLTKITIPNSFISIGEFAFYGCSSLTNITIPNSVTSIGDDSFSRCSSITNITILNSANSIGNFAFDECPKSIWE